MLILLIGNYSQNNLLLSFLFAYFFKKRTRSLFSIYDKFLSLFLAFVSIITLNVIQKHSH